jgi:hypothetical protein
VLHDALKFGVSVVGMGGLKDASHTGSHREHEPLGLVASRAVRPSMTRKGGVAERERFRISVQREA